MDAGPGAGRADGRAHPEDPERQVARSDERPLRAFVALSRTNYLALRHTFRERLGEVRAGDVELLDRSLPEPRWRGLARIVARAGRYDAVVVDGSVGPRQAYVDLLAAALIRWRPHGPVVVVSDCPWKRGAPGLERAARSLAVRLLDGPNVTYTVPTRAEVDLFASNWGVDPTKVVWTPWPFVLSERDLGEPTSRTGGVFAGGDSLRDYEPVIAAARGLDAPVTIATRRPDVVRRNALPPNVHAGPVSPARYVELLRSASVVVVPLAETRDRSAGETTISNALALGKVVVVPERLGVRDYVEHGRTGFVVPPGDPEALRRVLAWTLDPANALEVEAIEARARGFARSRLDPDTYVLRLLAAAAEAVSRARAAQPP